MKKFDPIEHQHVRYNPLKDEWLLVSPHRCKRPWSGQTEDVVEEDTAGDNPLKPGAVRASGQAVEYLALLGYPPSGFLSKMKWLPVSPHRCKRPWSGQTEDVVEEDTDGDNPLKPGAVRVNRQRNPDYKSTYVFPNDFPALLERVPEPPEPENRLFQSAQAKGTCRVMCFHPDSKMTIPLMSIEEILAVINEWINQLTELGRKYIWVQIFENKGAVMGCSNPHPHCQIWASSFLPNELRVKERCQKEYYVKYGKSLLVDYLENELQKKDRIVLQNAEWVALVPYWAAWPYETMLLPLNNHPQRMTDLNEAQKTGLAEIMKGLNTKYDNLFKCSFPYSMGWHGAPTGPSQVAGDSPHWLLHALYLPPLLRSASVKKFMVGYEMLAQPQRDLTPEQAAEKLRECDHLVHYKNVK